MKKTLIKLMLVFLISLLYSCSSLPDWVIRRGPNRPRLNTANLDETRKKLVEGAYYLEGKNKIKIRNRVFNMDCTGTVLGIYYYAGIDLSQDFSKYSGTGVKRLYDTLKDKELLFTSQYPQPGDIIFWDNTWDRNHDGIANDYLSHVGMVVEADKDGQITYIHEHYKKGIVLEYMNLKEPDTWMKKENGKNKIVNSPMRMKGSKKHSGWLSSHLFRIFGKAYIIKTQEES